MTTATQQTEQRMRKANAKLITAVATAIFAVGAAAGYFVPPTIHVDGAGLAELREQHVRDIGEIRRSLDAITVSATRSEAQLALVVQMLRDHTTAGGKP